MTLAMQIIVFIMASALAYYLITKGSKGKEFLARRFGLWFGTIYGVMARIGFAADTGLGIHLPKWIGDSFSVMTFSFVVLVPLVIGIIDQITAPEDEARDKSWWSMVLMAFFHPMISVLLMVIIVSAFALEGTICIVMALPILLGAGGAGGLIGLAVQKIRKRRASKSLLFTFAILPYIAAPIETRTAPETDYHIVTNTIEMSCSPEAVWNEVKSVPRIEDHEIPWTFAHLIGLPKPREALLSDEKNGAIRVATFDGGLQFRETVTIWEPGKAISFNIHALPAPPEVLDEHVSVGGPYFDVLQGGYEIEKLGENQIKVKLSSKHRLSTTFNWYASFWTKWVMKDLQYAILTVIKNRCE